MQILYNFSAVFWGTAVLGTALLQPVRAQTGVIADTIAGRITVLLEVPGSAGSGVLYEHKGNTYTVLTAKHVVNNINPGEYAFAVTPDGQRHRLNTNQIVKQPDVDLAFIQFKSNTPYPIANKGNSRNLRRLQTIYVAGYSLPGNALPAATLQITEGRLSNIGQYGEGYGLVYTNVTKAGMSGGPVLDVNGLLVGIHGKAEGEKRLGLAVKDGLNLGIPISKISQSQASRANFIPGKYSLSFHKISGPNNCFLRGEAADGVVIDRNGSMKGRNMNGILEKMPPFTPRIGMGELSGAVRGNGQWSGSITRSGYDFEGMIVGLELTGTYIGSPRSGKGVCEGRVRGFRLQDRR